MDLVRSFVSQAKANFPEVEFVTSNACSLPFEDETFEYALFSWNGIDHINPEELRYWALQERHRVLKPGGVFVFSTHNLWSTFVIRSLDLEGVRKFVDFWRRNVRRGRIFSNYKIDNTLPQELQQLYYSSR